MYFDNRCNCNEFQYILSRTGDSTTVIVKLTWSTVDFSLLHSIVDEWKSYKILRTIASGTSSEFFVVIYKRFGRSYVPSDVPVCRVVNEVWKHVNDCPVCHCESPKRKTDDNIFKPARFDGLALLYGCGTPPPPGFFGSLFSRNNKQNMRVELRANPGGALVPYLCTTQMNWSVIRRYYVMRTFHPTTLVRKRGHIIYLTIISYLFVRPLLPIILLTQSTYGNALRYAQKKGALTVGNKIEYVDNPEDGYYRVVKKKTVKVFGKEICDAHPIDAYKRIPYKNLPVLSINFSFVRPTPIPLLRCLILLKCNQTLRLLTTVMKSAMSSQEPEAKRRERK